MENGKWKMAFTFGICDLEFGICRLDMHCFSLGSFGMGGHGVRGFRGAPRGAVHEPVDMRGRLDARDR